MQVVTRSTPACFIFETCTLRSVTPNDRAWSLKAILAPTDLPYFSNPFFTPVAQSADCGTE